MRIWVKALLGADPSCSSEYSNSKQITGRNKMDILSLFFKTKKRSFVRKKKEVIEDCSGEGFRVNSDWTRVSRL